MSQAAPDLRPLNIGEVLDVAIKIYWRHALTLFKIVAIVVVPLNVLAYLIFASAFPELVLDASAGTLEPNEVPVDSVDDLWAFFAGIFVLLLVYFIGSTLANAACFKAVGDAYLGQQPDWKESLRFAGARLLSLMWVVILYFVVVAVGVVACILPGIWIAVAWSLAIPALLTEGVRGGTALNRSYGLVRGRWWATFGALFLAQLLAGLVAQIATFAFQALTFTDLAANVALSLALNTVATIVSSIITTPFMAAILTVLYFDLRVRKEGFDLELLAQRIGAEPGPRPDFLPPPPAPRQLPGAIPPSPSGGEQPPFWPPPPGWRPGGGTEGGPPADAP